MPPVSPIIIDSDVQSVEIDPTLSPPKEPFKGFNDFIPNSMSSTDFEGTTALYLAAKAGNDRIVKLLLNSGSDPTLCNKSRRTAPHYAALKSTMMRYMGV